MTTDLPGWSALTIGENSRSGFDIDLVKWLASRLDFTPNYVDLTLAQRESALRGGADERKAHLVAAVFSITDERRKRVMFAGPYMVTRQGFMVRKGDTRINAMADLKGKTVCTGAGTTSLKQLKDSGIKMNVTDEQGMNACVARLLEGKSVDAVSTDQLMLAGLAQTDPERLEVLPDLTFGAQERYGLGLPLGDVADCEIVTKELQDFINQGYWSQFFRQRFPGLEPDPYQPDPFNLNACE
ncbi:transporter substrate-binding domain-containing protein [Nonomuraea jiangxiensis]|uniref:transporter substrate-binding domain-containing protein n=1 Tax=Nonomuraea jiangxiensis TaxID=633440 RepID=UPI00159FF657|nr:transporter substrate-binding domain-containing protein [Nonomuraea jiangxiensis]